MRPKKSRTEAKSEALIVRVDQKMKFEIGELAKENRREISDYLRLILEDTIKNKTRV